MQLSDLVRFKKFKNAFYVRSLNSFTWIVFIYCALFCRLHKLSDIVDGGPSMRPMNPRWQMAAFMFLPAIWYHVKFALEHSATVAAFLKLPLILWLFILALHAVRHKAASSNTVCCHCTWSTLQAQYHIQLVVKVWNLPWTVLAQYFGIKLFWKVLWEFFLLFMCNITWYTYNIFIKFHCLWWKLCCK